MSCTFCDDDGRGLGCPVCGRGPGGVQGLMCDVPNVKGDGYSDATPPHGTPVPKKRGTKWRTPLRLVVAVAAACLLVAFTLTREPILMLAAIIPLADLWIERRDRR